MTEADQPIERGLEHQRQVHINTVRTYIYSGGNEEALQVALEFFDRDTATLMQLLDKLTRQLGTDNKLEPNQRHNLETVTGRLYDLRELFTPPPAR